MKSKREIEKRQREINWVIEARFPGFTSDVREAVDDIINASTEELAIDDPKIVNHVLANCVIHKNDLIDNEAPPTGIYTDYSPTELSADVGRWLVAVNNYSILLKEMLPKEFFILRDTALRPLRIKLETKRQREDEERFFNEPRAEADWDHWLTFPRWTTDEATALSLNKDPRVVTTKSLAGLITSPFRETYRQRRARIQGAIDVGQLESPFSPRQFVNCIQSYQYFELPQQMTAEEELGTNWRAKCEELQKRINKLEEEATPTNLKASANDVDVDSLEAMAARPRLSLSKLAYGLAHFHYFEKSRKRDDFDYKGINANKIMEKLAFLPECRIDHGNISARLEEAAELIIKNTKKDK